MSDTLGSIKGQMILDVKLALASYTAVRQQHVSTVTALSTGGAAIAASGAAMAGVGLAMAGGFMTAVNAAAEFERKLDFFAAVSNATQDEFELIRQKALQLGADTIYSADQVADSFTELAKSGVSVQGLLNGIGEAVTYLGAATDMPLAEAATSLTTILNTFAISAEDAVSVVDKLAGAANSSSIDVQDLITTMTYAGASAKTAGVSFEDVNTAIALLGERGIKGSKAGTGLRQMFDKLLAPTNKGKEALADLGLILEDGTNKLHTMEGGLKPIPELLSILNGALDGLSASEKTDILGNIFPITSLPTILNLLDGGADAMARLTAEIGKTTAMDIADKRLDNLSGDIEILRGNLDTLAIDAGGSFQNFARTIVQGVTAMVQAFMDLPENVQTTVLIIGALVSALLILIGTLGIFAGSMLNIISLATRMAPALSALVNIIKSLILGIKALALALATTPIGRVIALIGLLVAALAVFFTQTETGQQVWSQLMATFQQVAAVVMPMLQNLVQVVGGALASAFQAIGPIIQQVGTFLSGFLPTALGVLVDVFQQVITAIQPLLTVLLGAISSIITYFAPLGETLAQSVGQIAAAFAPVGQQIISELLPALVELGSVVIQLLDQFGPLILLLLGQFIPVIGQIVTGLLPPLAQLISSIVPIIAQLVGVFLQLAGQLIAVLLPVLVQLISAILPVIVSLFQAIVPVISALVTAFVPLIQTLVDILIPVLQFLVEVVTAVFTAIAPIIQAALDVVIGIINTVTALLKGDWEGVWNGILSILQGVWNLIVSVIQGTINVLVTLITGLVNIVVDLWTSLWNNVSNFLKDAWNNISNGVREGIVNVVRFFIQLPGTIMNAISGIGTWLINAGRDLIGGFISGIQDMIGAVGDAIGGIMDFVGGFFPHSPAKRGPFSGSGWSSLLGSGAAILTQFIAGMASEQGSLQKQMEVMGNEIADFYDKVGAAHELDTQIKLAGNSASTISVTDSTAAQLALLTEQMEAIANKDTFNVEKLEINNPEAETASESLPTAIRKTAHVIG